MMRNDKYVVCGVWYRQQQQQQYRRGPARRAARRWGRRGAAPRPLPRTEAGRCAGCPSRPRESRRPASPTARGTPCCDTKHLDSFISSRATAFVRVIFHCKHWSAFIEITNILYVLQYLL
jgi:hypothetical protein